jgi:purine-binding chemotaxis protein CheW
MSSNGSRLQAQVAEIRHLFDSSFAAPEQSGRSAVEHMLAVQVGGERLAVPVAQLSGLTLAQGTILPVPSSVPELLGITGVSGVVVPVFSLAALLGIARSSSPCRWLMLCGGRQQAIALAVDLVEGHMAVPADGILARGDNAASHIKQAVRDGDILRGVVDLALLVEQIKAKGRS